MRFFGDGEAKMRPPRQRIRRRDSAFASRFASTASRDYRNKAPVSIAGSRDLWM
jgi:hypothetical protein